MDAFDSGLKLKKKYISTSKTLNSIESKIINRFFKLKKQYPNIIICDGIKLKDIHFISDYNYVEICNKIMEIEKINRDKLYGEQLLIKF